MTRKEAINYLKSSGMTEEQIKTVINVLTYEDCISREETILHISERLYETAMNNQGYEITMDKACEDIALDRLKTWINELPSVKPQRAKGHWIYERCDMYSCSKCGHKYTDLSCEQDGMNFCPNCGADMRGGKMTNEDIPIEYFESGGC